MQRFKVEEEGKLKEYFQMHEKYSLTSQEPSLIGMHYKSANGIDIPKTIEGITKPLIQKLRDQIKDIYSSLHDHPEETFRVSVTKAFVFDACHFLPYHNRRCKYLHGHTYHMEVTLRGDVDTKTGMVMDFGELKKLVEKELLDDWDHGFLNEQIDYPTAEIMVLYSWVKIAKALGINYPILNEIKIWETDGSYVTLKKEDVLLIYASETDSWNQ